jgi:hypothetical protein
MKNKEIVAILSIIFIVSAFALANIATANVPTSGVIPSTAYPPVIKWKWELPDDDPYVSCCQVTPVAGGSKDLTAYFVATDPEGASNIANGWIRVFYPDGSVKVSKIDAVVIPVAEAESAIDAGVAAGCIPSNVANDMKSELEHGEAVAFKAVFTMYYYEAPGSYTVRAFVTDKWGNEVSYDNTFEYYELKAFAIDFNDGVDFGVLTPCNEKIISGDTDMSTPDKPTIRNIGNVPIYIKVHFSEMTGESDPTHKITGKFDARFKGEKVYLDASQWYTFTDTLNVLETQYMDFSLHPPYGTPVDTYRGSLDIMIGP